MNVISKTSHTSLYAARYNRDEEVSEVDGITIISTLQSSGKVDNMFINFEDGECSSEVLDVAFTRDPFNCYPYVIVVSADKIADTKKMATEFGFEDRVVVLPYIAEAIESYKELTRSAAYAKGASKGFNGSKSQCLDKITLAWQSTVVAKHDPTLLTICPRETGTTNEDVRVTTTNGTKVFRQENKSISQQLNITERLHMVGGKGAATGDSCYDLFMSFVGYELSFLDCVTSHGVEHIASAYVEFSRAEQVDIMMERNGIHPTLDNKRVMRPVDAGDVTKGMVEAELLSEYIVNAIRANS